MFEKVNPSHPDKVADRIAGAIVDYAYAFNVDPKMAVEVLIGHGVCYVIAETSVHIPLYIVEANVKRIAGADYDVEYVEVEQDAHLASNQAMGFRCGDNGIFRGLPVTDEQKKLCKIARQIYAVYGADGKYIIDDEDKKLIICQSNASTSALKTVYTNAWINPLGRWKGGPNVDAGATNRKLGSDMGDALTGGGLHGKDLSKADVSANIYAHELAQATGHEVEMVCAIGDADIKCNYYDPERHAVITAYIPFKDIVEFARKYIKDTGGFERFAEWGLVS